MMNEFTKRKIAEQEALYVAMCTGKVTQYSIHRKPVKGSGYFYHGHM